MKGLIIFISIFFFVSAGHHEQIQNVELLLRSKIGELMERMPKEVFLNMMEDFEGFEEFETGVINADVSEYVDKIMLNAKQFMTDNGLDPLSLPNENVEMPVGHINLTNGWLSDISSVGRSDEVVVSYNSATRQLSLDLPITFKDISFTYDFHARVTLISVDGGVIGEIKNIKAHVEFTFDFNELHAKLDKFNIRDTGSIHIRFTGSALLDWIINILSDVLTTFLHPIILDVVQLVIKNVMNTIIDTINNVIDQILHRTYL